MFSLLVKFHRPLIFPARPKHPLNRILAHRDRVLLNRRGIDLADDKRVLCLPVEIASDIGHGRAVANSDTADTTAKGIAGSSAVIAIISAATAGNSAVIAIISAVTAVT